MMSRATFARRHFAETEWELSNQAAENARLIWMVAKREAAPFWVTSRFEMTQA
jgi:hypothetical protein